MGFLYNVECIGKEEFVQNSTRWWKMLEWICLFWNSFKIWIKADVGSNFCRKLVCADIYDLWKSIIGIR